MKPALLALALALGLGSAHALPVAQVLDHGLFTGVRIYRPSGTPRQFVMLVSANDKPDATEQVLVDKMLADGAMVADIPWTPFYRKLEAQDGKCTYAAGAFENLSRHVQAYDRLPTYLLPMVMASGSVSAVAYLVLAQAPAGTFSSGMSLDFCPILRDMKSPPCASPTVKWQPGTAGSYRLQPAAAPGAPWTGLQGGPQAACQPAEAQAFAAQVAQGHWVAAAGPSGAVPPGFQAAYETLAAKEKGLDPPPAQLADLPVIELPVPTPGQRMVVLLSGDGGWAAIDKGIAGGLVHQGLPVVGIDSLRYFWARRTPEGLAADLDRVIRYYADKWRRSDIILIGYSQGADVLPFAVNRLPARTRARVKLTALLGLGQNAAFEFHVTNWIGPSGDKPILPEAQRLSAADTVCVYGQDEKDSLCPSLAPAHAKPLALAGGHHFGGDYDALASKLLQLIGN